MLSELLLTEMARLAKKDNMPLHRQLYEALRRALLDGKLAAGERLPSSRDLAQDLNLSRNTVVAAINQLSVEGYLEKMLFAEGTYIRKGQTLFVIDPRVYRARVDKAKAQLNKARAQALKAKRDLDRIRPLFEQSAASQEVARGIEHIATMAEQNKQATRQTHDQTTLLEDLAAQLQSKVSHFRT